MSAMSFDQQQFLNAHRRYQGYRDAAYDLTWEQLRKKAPNGCDLRVMPFDNDALSFWRAIRHFNAVHPAGGFPWDQIYWQTISTPRRFDVSVWDGEVLCGLASGMASRGDESVTLKWIERFNSAPNQMKGFVTEVAITAADHYAKIIGRRQVRLKEPNPGTEARYAAKGFTLAPKRLGVIYYQRDVA
jgi:hypothetical protein